MTKKIPKKRLKNYSRFSGMAFQMGGIIFVGVKAGQWLDKRYPNSGNYFTIFISLFAVISSLYLVIKQAININKDK